MKQKVLSTLEKVLSLTEGDAAEAILIQKKYELTRFSNNYIHQNMAEQNTQLQLRVIIGGREGSFTTNRLDKEGLKQAANAAKKIALAQPKNPSLPPLPRARKTLIFENSFASTERCSPAKRASMVKKVIDYTKKHKATASGALSTSATVIGVANTSGIRSCQNLSKASFNFVPFKDELSGYSYWAGADIDKIPLKKLIQEAVEKVCFPGSPVTLPPGKYQVVLSPYAACNLVYNLSMIGFGAKPFIEKRSFMCKKKGKKVASDKITIFDHGKNPAGIPTAFDFEGVPKKKVYFIKKGIAEGLVHDSRTAAKMRVKSTGHALPSPNTFGPYAHNLFMSAGNTPESKMVSNVERGLYITKFHYVNILEAVSTVMTGMTKDGTFLIEKGRLTAPVRNLRFTQNILEALKKVEAVGKSRRTLAPYGSITAPGISIREFQFTGVSEM